jgi:hypothetical protein
MWVQAVVASSTETAACGRHRTASGALDGAAARRRGTQPAEQRVGGGGRSIVGPARPRPPRQAAAARGRACGGPPRACTE